MPRLPDHVEWDETWFARAEALDDDDARVLLDDADAWRAELGDGPLDLDVERALVACYAALLPRFAVPAEQLLDRLRWACRRLRMHDERARSLYRWALNEAGIDWDEETRDGLRLDRAACEASLGRPDAAREAFRDVLRRRRGSDSRLELRALLGLATAAQLDLSPVESLLLHRRAARLAARLGLVEPQVVAACNELPTLADLELEDEVASVLERLDELLAGVAAPRRPYYAGHALRFRAWLAGRRGDVERCRALLAELEAGPVARPVGAQARGMTACLHAGVARRRERWADVLERVESALGDGDVPEPWASVLVARRIDALTHLGRRAEARRLGVTHLARLTASSTGASDRRLGRALGLLAEALDELGEEEHAARAATLAADAALRSVATLERAGTALPELVEHDPRDTDILERVREAVQHRHARRCAAVVDLVQHSPRYVERLTHRVLRRVDGAYVVCAWCHRHATRSGVWLPLLPYLARLPETVVTHGICESCERRVGESRLGESDT